MGEVIKLVRGYSPSPRPQIPCPLSREPANGLNFATTVIAEIGKGLHLTATNKLQCPKGNDVPNPDKPLQRDIVTLYKFRLPSGTADQRGCLHCDKHFQAHTDMASTIIEKI